MLRQPAGRLQYHSIQISATVLSNIVVSSAYESCISRITGNGSFVYDCHYFHHPPTQLHLDGIECALAASRLLDLGVVEPHMMLATRTSTITSTHSNESMAASNRTASDSRRSCKSYFSSCSPSSTEMQILRCGSTPLYVGDAAIWRSRSRCPRRAA